MESLSKSISLFGTILAASLMGYAITGSAQPSGARQTALPSPQLSPGELPRPACNPNTREALRNSVGTSSQAVTDRLTPSIRGELYLWAEQKLRYANSMCIEWPYTVGKLQQALGNPVTNVLELADIDKIMVAMDKGREYRVKQADGRADLEEDRPRTLLDFLPKAGNISDRQCDALQGRAEAEMRNRLNQWGSRNPPGPGRAAAWSAMEQEERSRIYAVAPGWAEFWASQPALAAWAKASRCEGIKLRFQIEAWQVAAGLERDASNLQSIEQSRDILAQAAEKLAQFRGSQDRKLQADAERSGDTARARTWMLDELNGRTRLTDVQQQMPEALCQLTGAKLTCRKPPVCDSAQRALVAARATSREAAQQADDALRICTNRFRFSAAARSEIMFAGQKLRDAEIQFDNQGIVSMKLTVLEDSDPVRNALTRRYGIPETQQQTRTRTETRFGGGGVGYTDTGRMVTVNPSAQAVEVPYSVTRYVWKTPKVIVEEVTGELQFRFAGN